MNNINFFHECERKQQYIYLLFFYIVSKKGQEDGGEGPIEPPWVQNELEQKELYCVTVCSELAFTAM